MKKTKVNIHTCTLDEYKKACELVKTENCATSFTYDMINMYNTEWKV